MSLRITVWSGLAALVVLAALQPWSPEAAAWVKGGPMPLARTSASAVLHYQRVGFACAAILWGMLVVLLPRSRPHSPALRPARDAEWGTWKQTGAGLVVILAFIAL